MGDRGLHPQTPVGGGIPGPPPAGPQLRPAAASPTPAAGRTPPRPAPDEEESACPAPVVLPDGYIAVHTQWLEGIRVTAVNGYYGPPADLRAKLLHIVRIVDHILDGKQP